MYKFANGIVVFDEKTRDRYIQAGYKIVEVDKSIERVAPISDELNKAIIKELKKVIDENTSNNGTVKKKPRRSKKTSKSI